MNRILVILLCYVLASCRSSEKIVYLQDVGTRSTEEIAAYSGISVQPKDILSIVVSSPYADLVATLNLPLSSFQAGSDATSSSYSQRLLGYLVDLEGNIDFPSLGKIKVEGKTREGLSSMIKGLLQQDSLIRDPIVNVEFMNFKISVLGEVRYPGMFNLQHDRITIFEAIGRAGDLTIYGRRDNVLVTREQNGVIENFRVDLRSSEVYRSPVYYLQQNDVVYVSPNEVVAARSRINENRSLGIWISVASFLASLATLIANM